MRDSIIKSVALATLVLAPAMAFAQGAGGERGGGAEHGGGGGEGAGAGHPGGGAQSPGAHGPEGGAMKAAPRDGGGQEGPAGGEPRGGAARPGPSDAARPGPKGGERARSEQPGAETGAGADKGARSGGERAGGERAGRAQGGGAHISTEQRSRVRSSLRGHGEALHGVDFAIGVGTVIPPRYHFYPLPPDIIEFLPEYRGYDYIIVDDEILILEPGTRRIVDVID